MLEGNKDYIFELFDTNSRFTFEDEIDSEVFDDFETISNWLYEEATTTEVFDPEFNPQKNIMTETSEDLLTEDGIELVY